MHLAEIPDNFVELLEPSIEQWRSQVKAVWLEIPNNRLDLVPICGSFGFYPHHVSDRGIMMALWLSPSPNTLPTYSTHYIGAGGLVFKDNEILAIKLENSIYGNVSWKLPGGLVNHNESILEGAVREVKEETGVLAEALGIIGFRERNHYMFDRGDIYYTVLMNAISTEIAPDGREVKEAVWVDFHEWLNEYAVGDTPKFLRDALGESEKPPKERLFERMLNLRNVDVRMKLYENTHKIYTSSSSQ